jgi:hypothetical protein
MKAVFGLLLLGVLVVSGCMQSNQSGIPNEFYCLEDDDCAPCSNSECANVNYLEVADCPGNRCGTYIKECKCVENLCTPITGDYFTDRGQPVRSGC